MNIKKTIVIPVLIVAAGIGIFQALHASKPQPETKQPEIRSLSVFVEPAQLAEKRLAVTTHGEVRSRSQVSLLAEVAGRVVAVNPNFVEGGEFAAGEVLVQIDDRDYRLAVTAAKARVASAQVNLEQALADADVARKQLRGVADPSPLALKKPQVTEAKANLQAAQAELAIAELRLERTQISLPFAGRIISRRVGLGEYVNAGTPMGEVFDNHALEIRVPLNDSDLRALAKPLGYISQSRDERDATIKLLLAGRDYRWNGRLRTIDANISSDSRLVYGLVEMTGVTGVQAPPVGAFVDVALQGAVLDQALLIPTAGLRPGNRVYLVDEQQRLAIVDVDVLYQDSEHVVVAHGLDVGDQVIVSAMRDPVVGLALSVVDAEG